VKYSSRFELKGEAVAMRKGVSVGILAFAGGAFSAQAPKGADEDLWLGKNANNDAVVIMRRHPTRPTW
jgi:hypothetical protein